jgi:hypothetical protein
VYCILINLKVKIKILLIIPTKIMQKISLLSGVALIVTRKPRDPKPRDPGDDRVPRSDH